MKKQSRPVSKENIYANLPESLEKERIETLVNQTHLQLERIISLGHRAPSEGWFDQEHNEWVVLLKGQAQLEFENGHLLMLDAGDYLHIKAHVRHRVTWTCPDVHCVWLALHYDA